MSRRTAIALIVLAGALLMGVAWYLLRAPMAQGFVAESRPLVRTLLFSARVASASRVEVGSTLTGRVEQVAVAEGAHVRRNDTLLRLESNELRAALDQARASERQASARLQGLKSTGRSVAQAGVAQADAVLRAVQAELQRNEELVARGFVSAARLDESRRAVAVALAQREAAQAQLMATGDTGTDVVQAQAQLALAHAAVAAALAKLAQTTIAAPADARVLARNVEPGQIVQPGRALLTLALASPVQLVGQVDERYLEQLKVGQKASVRADAFPHQPFEARVQSIAPVVDAQRGAVEVKLLMPQSVPAFLREDMTLSVEVVTGQRERALAVPIAALTGAQGNAAVTLRVVNAGRVEFRSVRLGLTTLDAVEVVEGLAAGEVVLLGPSPAAGARVRVNTDAPVLLSTSPRAKGTREDAGAAMGTAMGR